MGDLEITPELVLRGYTIGIFPMAESREGEIVWCAPEQRGIMEFSSLKVSRSLSKILHSRRFNVTFNRAFPEVVRACADRDETWISAKIEDIYCRLHARGFAHSIEVWDETELAGGLYGVAIGGAFFGESMFHRIRDASKVALVYLVRHLASRGFTLLDMQYLTPHLESMGGSEIHRDEYIARLRNALIVTATFHEEDTPTGILPFVQSDPATGV